MDTFTYLILEYLTYLLLVIAAGAAALLCIVLVMGIAGLAHWVSGKWEGVVRPALHELRQDLAGGILVVSHPHRWMWSAGRKTR